ncbi:cytidine deaminase [Niabella hirudinis]|uniref:cytidine deaminase n=1 Tax=Niabella hirudinis TaxID=1285929 RepID=UPI003EBFCCC1
MMQEKKFQFSYKILEDSHALADEDAALLELARATTQKAYAPYSGFHVACAAKLANGSTVVGTNQENASYPVGICAERALLAAVGSGYNDEPILTLAISYHPVNGSSNRPVSPCGMCRQALSEYEKRTGTPIRLLLSGMEGPVYVINTIKDLLPLAFSEDDLC